VLAIDLNYVTNWSQRYSELSMQDPVVKNNQTQSSEPTARNTYIDCTGTSWSPIFYDLHLEMILMRVFLIVELSYKVNNPCCGINGEVIGLLSRVSNQIVIQRKPLMRVSLHFDDPSSNQHSSRQSRSRLTRVFSGLIAGKCWSLPTSCGSTVWSCTTLAD